MSYTKVNAMRDNVHGWIKYTPEIKAIFNHPFMQRLKECKQLSCVDQVFPGATHNRFQHSLGVMHISRKYMKHLIRTGPLEITINGSSLIRLAEVAGLLHDIGHGPFMHLEEQVMKARFGKTHRKIGVELVRTEMSSLLERAGFEPTELVKIFSGDSDSLESRIISGSGEIVRLVHK